MCHFHILQGFLKHHCLDLSILVCSSPLCGLCVTYNPRRQRTSFTHPSPSVLCHLLQTSFFEHYLQKALSSAIGIAGPKHVTGNRPQVWSYSWQQHHASVLITPLDLHWSSCVIRNLTPFTAQLFLNRLPWYMVIYGIYDMVFYICWVLQIVDF